MKREREKKHSERIKKKDKGKNEVKEQENKIIKEKHIDRIQANI